MKTLAIADPHGKIPKNIDNIIKKNKIEAIVCLGDIPPVPVQIKKGETIKQALNRAERRYKEIIDKLCSYNLPVLTLRGNLYTHNAKYNKITKNIFLPNKNLYYKKTGKVTINGQDFVLFDMIWEKQSARRPGQFNKVEDLSNKRRERKLNSILKKAKNPVVMSHAPPYGHLDKIYSGKHVGSKVLLRAIKKYQPLMVLCGHIHEAKGKSKIGKTDIYNLGCCGDYKIFDIEV